MGDGSIASNSVGDNNSLPNFGDNNQPWMYPPPQRAERQQQHGQQPQRLQQEEYAAAGSGEMQVRQLERGPSNPRPGGSIVGGAAAGEDSATTSSKQGEVLVVKVRRLLMPVDA